MEQADRATNTVTSENPAGITTGATDGVTRSQHAIYTLPHTTEALAQLLPSALERIDAADGGVQLVIMTADAETAVVLSDLVHRLVGPQGIEVVPVTSANRAARLLADSPVHAVVGPAPELQALVQRSVLKLATVRTIVLAWTDDILRTGPATLAALEVLFSELPKESARIIVARRITGEVEALIDRYARTARRVKGGDEGSADERAPTLVRYVVVSRGSRAIALRRVLDDLDPPSAAVVVRSNDSRAEAARTLTQLGYRRADDAVRVVNGAVTEATHTVILFDAPVSQGELANVAEGVVNIVALVTPSELGTLREIATETVPLTLSGPAASARGRERALRDELAELLARGVPAHELLALEPLLEQYDGAEVAAAALTLLELARAKAKEVKPAPAARPQESQSWNDRSTGRGSAPPKRDFRDRPKGDAGDRPPRRDFADRPKRDFDDRPPRDFRDRPKREFSDRPKRDFSDRPKRDFSDRPKREFGDRPKRDFGGEHRPGGNRSHDDRPGRDFGDRRKGNFGRGPRER